MGKLGLGLRRAAQRPGNTIPCSSKSDAPTTRPPPARMPQLQPPTTLARLSGDGPAGTHTVSHTHSRTHAHTHTYTHTHVRAQKHTASWPQAALGTLRRYALCV